MNAARSRRSDGLDEVVLAGMLSAQIPAVNRSLHARIDDLRADLA